MKFELSLKKGSPRAIVEGGKYNKEIIHIFDKDNKFSTSSLILPACSDIIFKNFTDFYFYINLWIYRLAW